MVILACEDGDEDGMDQSFPYDSPFLAFKFEDEHIASMKSSWNIPGKPYLAVINLDGKLIWKPADLTRNEIATELGAGAAVVDQWVENGENL